MSIVILCVIAMGLYAVLDFIEKRAQKWYACHPLLAHFSFDRIQVISSMDDNGTFHHFRKFKSSISGFLSDLFPVFQKINHPFATLLDGLFLSL